MIANILDILSLLLILSIVPTAWLVYKKRINFLNGVFLGTFLFLLSFGCSVYVSELLYGYSPIDYAVNSTVSNFMTWYESTPGITAQQISEMKQAMVLLKDIYFVLMPTVIVVSNLFWSYLFLMLAKGILALFRKDVSGFSKFCDFKMPKSAVLFAIAAYILSMLFKVQQVGYAFMNFASIIFIVTSFCGLSMVDFWLRKKIRFSIIRVVIYIVGFGALSLLMGLGASIILFVGIADASFDFRSGPVRIKKDNE